MRIIQLLILGRPVLGQSFRALPLTVLRQSPGIIEALSLTLEARSLTFEAHRLNPEAHSLNHEALSFIYLKLTGYWLVRWLD